MIHNTLTPHLTYIAEIGGNPTYSKIYETTILSNKMELIAIWYVFIFPVACNDMYKGAEIASNIKLMINKIQNDEVSIGTLSPSHMDNIEDILNIIGQAIMNNNKNEYLLVEKISALSLSISFCAYVFMIDG